MKNDDAQRDEARHVHRVLDPSANGSLAPEDLERILDKAHREGWEFVASVLGLFSEPSRKTPSRRSLLVFRRFDLGRDRRSTPLPRITGAVTRIPGSSSGETVGNVVRAAARAFGVEATDVLSRPFRKTRHVTNARQVAAYLLRDAGLSFPEIGTALSHMDHTSAIGACRKVERDPGLLAVARGLVSARVNTQNESEKKGSVATAWVGSEDA